MQHNAGVAHPEKVRRNAARMSPEAVREPR